MDAVGKFAGADVEVVAGLGGEDPAKVVPCVALARLGELDGMRDDRLLAVVARDDKLEGFKPPVVRTRFAFYPNMCAEAILPVQIKPHRIQRREVPAAIRVPNGVTENRQRILYAAAVGGIRRGIDPPMLHHDHVGDDRRALAHRKLSHLLYGVPVHSGLLAKGDRRLPLVEHRNDERTGNGMQFVPSRGVNTFGMKRADVVGAASAAKTARDSRDFQTEQAPARGVVVDRTLLRGFAGLPPEFRTTVVNRVRNKRVADALEYPRRIFHAIPLRPQRVDLIEPGARIRRTRAVVGGEEPVQKRLQRLVGLPKELRHQIRLKFGEIRMCGVVSRVLLVHVGDAVILEEPEVGSQRHRVGEGMRVVAEVDDVVPDVEVGRHLPPSPQILGELPLVLVAAFRNGAVAVGAGDADAGHDVGEQLRLPRRLDGIGVRQRLDHGVGTYLRDLRGDMVDKADDGSRRRTFFLVHGLTLFAAAVVVVVVLAHAEILAFGMAFHDLQRLVRHDFHGIGVRQARLALPCAELAPDAVNLGEVFGMIAEVRLRRQQVHERMAVRQLRAVAEIAQPSDFRGCRAARQVSVVPEFRRERRMVHHVRRACIALDEIGNLPVAEIAGDGKRLGRWHHFRSAGEPAAPAIRLQQFIDAVQDASPPTAPDAQGVTLRRQLETVILKLAGGQLYHLS